MIDNSFDMFELKIYDYSYTLILKIPYDKAFFVLEKKTKIKTNLPVRNYYFSVLQFTSITVDFDW